MSILKLETWAAKLVQTNPLSHLKDATLGVDATYYLNLRLNENKDEPLKSALGGLPFALRSMIEDDLDTAKEAEVTLLFVFNGLDFVNKQTFSPSSNANVKAHDDGWRHYNGGDATSPVDDFGRAEYPLDILYRYLRMILQSRNIEYLVAPYSATAELAYMYKAPEPTIDAVMSSTDAFLFDVDQVVLDIHQAQSSFDWLKKSACEERANRTARDFFRDALLLTGSAFLPPFPVLERGPGNNKSSIMDAIALLNGANRSVLQLCHQYRDDPAVQALDYAGRYRKAVMTIKHHIVLDKDGRIIPLDFDHAPGDVHEFVGQRLPDELFHYISRGLIGAEVPNWLTSGVVRLNLPGGVVDSEPFRRLLIEQLNPLRAEALQIIAETQHYYFSTRVIELKSWDNRDTSSLKIELKTFTPLKQKASEWKVKAADLPSSTSKQPPSVLQCLSALKDKSFAQKSISKGKSEHPALRSQDEILSNVFWRFLQVRGYVSDKHELTNHGLMLEATLEALKDTGNPEELGVVAVELFRLGVLTTNSVTGAQIASADKDYKHRTSVNLISKIACLGRLRHEPIGYAGPLDRQLLSFAWMITAVRSSLRDLVEAVLVSMFLNGDVDRNREDWVELPQRLPFISDNGAALGVATKSYLDVSKDKEPTEALKSKIKNQEESYAWFAQAKDGTLHKSLDMAFGLFDAVHAGVKIASKDSKDTKTFTEVSQWLETRR